jgi:predicted nucleic-acid-binding Zn-ribbon protein
MEHWEMVNKNLTKIVSNTPETLWQNACNYFQWCDTNPISVPKTAMTGREVGKEFNVKYKRAYNIKALCLHCGIPEEYIRDIRQSKDKHSLYFHVISKILYIIYSQNLEGAMVDVFNPIFTAKVLNMEKEEVKSNAVTVTVVQGIPELSNSENEILEKLESENQILKITKEE